MQFRKLARSLLIRTHEAEGQTIAEYGFILALVAVAAVAALVLLGGAVVTPFTTFVDAAGIGAS